MSGKQAILKQNVIYHEGISYRPGDALPDDIAARHVEKEKAVWVIDAPDIEDLSYRELQLLAKSRGLIAVGKRAELVARLGASYGE